MNAKEQTVIAVALVTLVTMGLYPPFITCDSRGTSVCRYSWIVSLLEPEPECERGTWELATDRLFFQWGFVIAAAAILVRAVRSKSLEPLRGYEGATFHFTKYIPPSEDWRRDHCAGCGATFAEYDGPDILHEGYVTSVPYDETPDDS